MQSGRLQSVAIKHRWRLAAGLFLAGALWQVMERTAYSGTQIHSILATPATITFLATDPDSPTLTVPVTVQFRTTGGSNTKAWQLDLQATSGANMVGCPSAIPINKIQVSCVSSSVDNGGTGVCAAPFNLSTGLQPIASGMEGTGNAVPYQVVLNFTFQDSWRYIATNTACSVTLNYQIIAN